MQSPVSQEEQTAAFAAALVKAGSYTELAHRINRASRALGQRPVTRQAVHAWGRRGVPVERLLAFERATGIPRHRFAPELFDGYVHVARPAA